MNTVSILLKDLRGNILNGKNLNRYIEGSRKVMLLGWILGGYLVAVLWLGVLCDQ